MVAEDPASGDGGATQRRGAAGADARGGATRGVAAGVAIPNLFGAGGAELDRLAFDVLPGRPSGRPAGVVGDRGSTGSGGPGAGCEYFGCWPMACSAEQAASFGAADRTNGAAECLGGCGAGGANCRLCKGTL